MGVSMKIIDEKCVFEGRQIRFEHESSTLNCTMQFSVFLPPQAANEKVPAVYWLSGLTCTDENFSSKAGAQRVAAELGIALVIPDTSPRGDGVPDDPEAAYDFGLGAGFYVNATEKPWSEHYRMYDYIVEELPALVEQALPVSDQRAISGHSMGGHGALVIGLRNPDRYSSISAFSPIVNPTQCPWGEKALGHYLGSDRSRWEAYDAVCLLRTSDGKNVLPIKVCQGTADNFLAEQLKTDQLIAACREKGIPADIQYREGYDHSYYFISTFIEGHLRFHASNLR
ncbi:MAG: S-formylglutathione hydrolase FrmB [Idiomarinaceae bacterium HL-53]|nr:MAG: S-formylglutathione hydrolase FrmB [Idiomarinaceae bacterium HL-53]CUS49198.1 S-formylglutathione hydrolase [Idiomarinaceae bacterium HL-53]